MNTNPIIIFGAGGLGKAALEIFHSNNVIVYSFLDDDKSLHDTEINDVTVMGSTDDHGFLKLIGKKCDAFVAVNERKVRKKYFQLLKDRRKVMPVNAIHSQATISSNSFFSYGIFANAGAVVGSFAKVGQGCILHSNSVVDYEAELGNFVHVGAGSIIHSGATIEDNVFIGAGVTIAGPLTVGKGARVGAGSVVVEPVKAGDTVFGNPAKSI